MGAWSTSVTGNDVAQDMRDEFRAAFALNAPEDAVKKLDAYAKQAFLSDEWTGRITFMRLRILWRKTAY